MTAAPEGCDITTAAVQLKDGDTLAFGGEQIRALHTPGHTVGSMCYLWRDHVFTGDTLLINGCGRTDFQSGSAEALYRSITQRAVRAARRHDRLAGARLPGPDAHDHRGREGGQRADRRQDAGRIRRHHGRAPSAAAEAHRRGGAGQSHVRHPARRGRRGAARGAPGGGLRRRRVAAARLQVVAIRRGGADRRAHRRRARMGGLHSGRRAARVEAVAGHGDERRVRRRAARRRARRAGRWSCCAAAACAPSRRRSGRPSSAWRRTTSSKASKATPTSGRSAAARAAGAITGCPGGRGSSGRLRYRCIIAGGASGHDRASSSRFPRRNPERMSKRSRRWALRSAASASAGLAARAKMNPR